MVLFSLQGIHKYFEMLKFIHDILDFLNAR